VSSKGSKSRKSATASQDRRCSAWSQDLAPEATKTLELQAQPAEEASEHHSSSSTESSCPAGLVRTLVLTYRGRLLREEVTGAGSRFIDDAAIFVGRLVKNQETQLTLLKRFERYGRIVGTVPFQAHTRLPSSTTPRARTVRVPASAERASSSTTRALLEPQSRTR
jgi:hypothetical protein